jgi:N-acetylglutamate synthase-like GNAT family acetyltransferase
MDGLIKNEHAKATVKASNTLPAGVLEISNVFTEPVYRKQGYATELIKQITDAADESKTVLALMCKAELTRWYARFGFVTIQQKPILMARMPQIFKVNMKPIAQATDKAVNG